MPKATVTVRELKNKDTCIDLSVTSYREIPGLLRSTFEYQIVVVSSLSCFKLPSHKETDVVQFTLFRKFPEFEDLRAKLNEAFSGTVMPPLLKKSIIVNENVIKERRNNLDSFLKFLSATPRIVTSSPVLTFLDVEAQKAKRFASGEADEQSPQEKTSSDPEEKQEEKSAVNLFDEEEEEDGDEFLMGADTGTTHVAADEDDDGFFSSADARTLSQNNTHLFERQDLKRELTEDDEKDFSFVPDAIITKREVVKMTEDLSEDHENDELLNVEEDIDIGKLLTLETKGRKEEQQQQQSKPQPPSKPQIPQKPTIPSKPKPQPKPDTAARAPAAGDKPVPAERPKPTPAERPKPAPRKNKAQPTETSQAENAASVEVPERSAGKADMNTNDIMQYIAANAEGEEADLDLFS